MRRESTKSDHSALSEHVGRALAGPGVPTPEQLDSLITECAAQALQLRARRVRIERELEQVMELAAELRAVRDGFPATAGAS